MQVVKHETYLRIADSQHAKTVPLRPKRGPILDRNGQVLAVSSATESLFVLPARIDNARRLAGRLAPILDEPADDLGRRLAAAKRFTFVKRKLSPAAAQAVRDLGEPLSVSSRRACACIPTGSWPRTWWASRGWTGRGWRGWSRPGTSGWPARRAARSWSATPLAER